MIYHHVPDEYDFASIEKRNQCRNSNENFHTSNRFVEVSLHCARSYCFQGDLEGFQQVQDSYFDFPVKQKQITYRYHYEEDRNQ